MEELTYMRQLTFRYCEGLATEDEERQLFSFINKAETHKLQFRQWQAQWQAQAIASDETRLAWLRFEEKIQHRSRAKHFLFQYAKKLAVAATILLCMLFSASVAWWIATHKPEKYYAFMAPYGSKARLELPDKSVVWLNAGSSLRYSNKFSETNRRVALEGEAYFEVTKDPKNTFVVQTKVGDVVVKGTRFDVLAYKEDKQVNIALLQGRVAFMRGDQSFELVPGEQLTIDRQTGVVTKTSFETDAHAWVENKMQFEAISLDNLAKVLSRQYNVQIHIASSQLAAKRFSISLRNKETIGEVINALQRISNMKVKREGRHIYLFETE